MRHTNLEPLKKISDPCREAFYKHFAEKGKDLHKDWDSKLGKGWRACWEFIRPRPEQIRLSNVDTTAFKTVKL